MNIEFVENILDLRQKTDLISSFCRGPDVASSNDNIVHQTPGVELVDAVDVGECTDLTLNDAEVNAIGHSLVQSVDGLGHDRNSGDEDDQNDNKRECWVHVISPSLVNEVNNQALRNDEHSSKNVTNKVQVQLPDVYIVAHSASCELDLGVVIIEANVLIPR